MNPFSDRPQGAFARPDGSTLFRIWAPRAERVAVAIESAAPLEMRRDDDGFFEAVAPARPGALYRYVLDGRPLPDPASRFQPEGVHGPSAVIDPKFPWTDSSWKGVPLREAVFYELHVGTFTTEGTFDAASRHLDELKELGVTLIELMPVAQFPGSRNWGYDGVLLYAVQNSYGGPDGLRRLVDAAHARGLGVCLDVVYNHFGPEGNYLDAFGPYFTGKYTTPWGGAINYDDADSDAVREYFIANALTWVDEFHIDALRLDAVHAIFDQSAYPFLRELADRVHERAEILRREILLIPESDLNDPRLVRPSSAGGFGLDAHWSDDFHHSLHTLLTGEKAGYYEDFGRMSDLARSFTDAYVYAGRYSPHRRRRHGAPAPDLDGWQLVVAAQNHDQVGNRMNGERLTSLIGFEQWKLAAGALLCSPALPLLFMGEEWGETAPFLYFVSHGDEDLIEAVRKGRRSEFASFGWKEEPPDPQSETTFARSRVDRGLLEQPRHRVLRELYRELLRLRRSVPALGAGAAGSVEARPDEARRTLLVRRRAAGSSALIAMNFSDQAAEIRLTSSTVRLERALDTSEERWSGPGSRSTLELREGEAAISLAPHALAVWVGDSAD